MAKLPEVVVVERDARMWEMKKSGLSYRQIAKALQVSESTAYRGCKRVSDRIVKQLAIDHGQELILDLQRIEGMIASFLPMTRVKKIQTPDGDEVEIPPSTDAANTVLKLMAQKAKLLNLEGNAGTEINITQNNIGSMPILNTAVDEHSLDVEKTPEQEAKHLLDVMREAGVIDDEQLNSLLASNAVVVDAEVIEEGEVVDDAEIVDEVEPPEFIDDYDDEDDSWRYDV